MLYFFILIKNNEFCNQINGISNFDLKNQGLLIYNKIINSCLKFVLNEMVAAD